MSILGWFLKSKSSMAKEHTGWVKLGKYQVTSHAQNRVADKKRNLKKMDMVINLFGKSVNSKDYKHKDGTIQYDRVNTNNRTITHITKNNHVKTIQKFHNNSRGKKEAYKNFEK